MTRAFGMRTSTGAPVLLRQLGGLAAIDCGSNSTRLLVVDPSGRPLVRLMHITRLGRGVDGERRLAPDAIARTVEVLDDYRAVMDDCGVARVKMTATSAARDARNRETFFSAAEAIVGVRPELLTGEEEGRLSFAGATAGLDGAGAPYLVADIGGGSTEVAVGPVSSSGAGRLEPVAVRSLDMGCVRVTERWLAGDPPTARQLGAARRAVDEALVELSEQVPATRQAATLIGLAGTVAALAAIDQGLVLDGRDPDGCDHVGRDLVGRERRRDRLHHYRLARSSVDALLADLAGRRAAERVARQGVEAGRADVIVGGALVLAAVMDHFGFDSCLTSEADILDGLVMSLLD